MVNFNNQYYNTSIYTRYTPYQQGGYMPRQINRGNTQFFTNGMVNNKASTWYDIGAIARFGIEDLAKGDESLIGKLKTGVEWVIGLFKKD